MAFDVVQYGLKSGLKVDQLWKPFMYYGESHSALDDKGRLAVPVQFRRIMQVMDHDTWFVTRGFTNELLLYHKEKWEELVDANFPENVINPDRMNLEGFFLGGAAKVKLDRQGRLLIPQHLREYAGIDREGVLLGARHYLQLWSTTGWRAFQERYSQDYRNKAAELLGNTRKETAQPKEDEKNADN